MVEVVFEDAWRRDDPRLARDAMAFWKAFGLVADPAECERRTSELVALAYLDGSVVGVSTALLAAKPEFRARVAYYRCAIAPACRRQDLSYRLSGFARGVLERWSAAHPEEKVAGMAAVIQAAEYRDKQLEPTWPEHGLHLNLAYYLPGGEQIRVAWFSHARLKEE